MALPLRKVAAVHTPHTAQGGSQQAEVQRRQRRGGLLADVA